MVYVLSQKGKPLMPTCRHGLVRRLLKEKKAKVVRSEPFTIQLLIETTEFTQPISLGVDAGSKHVGLSATTETKELYSAEVELRTDIVGHLSDRRELRRSRRSRKLRYRKPRFNNRKKPQGWLPPSVEHKVQSHLRLIKLCYSFIPITKIVIEVAQFDTQLLKNPDISGTEYQTGSQQGFWNSREYVLFRDNHTCQFCHGKSKDPVLNVHHIESRKIGGDSPDNLITICETCHKAYHEGKIHPKIKRSFRSLRNEAMMTSMGFELYKRARHNWNNVHLTYGYITKRTRIENRLEKSHRVDARCISGNPLAVPCNQYWKLRQVPNHTRSLHVQKMTKGGKRRSKIAPRLIGDTRFKRYDKVEWNGKVCFIAGSTNGRPILRNIDWTRATPTPSVNPKTVTFLSRKRGGFLMQSFKNE